jgi:hypothetical protein
MPGATACFSKRFDRVQESDASPRGWSAGFAVRRAPGILPRDIRKSDFEDL